MSFNLADLIRKKSREEWKLLVKETWTETRIWIHEHGEYSAVIGFGLGLLVVCFLKVFVGVLAVGIIAAFIVYQVALPEEEMKRRGDSGKVSSNGHQSANSDPGDNPGV